MSRTYRRYPFGKPKNKSLGGYNTYSTPNPYNYGYNGHIFHYHPGTWSFNHHKDALHMFRDYPDIIECIGQRSGYLTVNIKQTISIPDKLQDCYDEYIRCRDLFVKRNRISYRQRMNARRKYKFYQKRVDRFKLKQELRKELIDYYND